MKKESVFIKWTAFTIIIFSLLFLICTMNSIGTDPTRIVVGAAYMNMNNSFFLRLNEGLKSVVESKNGKLISLDSQMDVNKQIEQIDYLIEEKVDIIVLNPTDWKKIKPALLNAKAAKIPVIVVDSPVYDDDLADCTIVSDNYKAGVLCGQSLVDKLGGKGNVVIMEHLAAKSAVDRIYGFESVINAFKGIKVVSRGNSNGQMDISMEKIQNILHGNLNVDAIMCLNDPTALGAAAALENIEGKKSILVYGIDGSEDALRLIKWGKMTGTSAQFPDKIGKMAGETAVKILEGDKVEKLIEVPVEFVDKSNIDIFY